MARADVGKRAQYRVRQRIAVPFELGDHAGACRLTHRHALPRHDVLQSDVVLSGDHLELERVAQWPAVVTKEAGDLAVGNDPVTGSARARLGGSCVVNGRVPVRLLCLSLWAHANP